MKLHLKFQIIPTSFVPVLASGSKSTPLRDKVSIFPEKSETLTSILHDFSLIFLYENHAKIVQKYAKEEKIGRGRKMRPKRQICPVVASDPGNLGHRISPKNLMLGLFRVSSYLASVISKKTDFWGTKSVDLWQHHGFAIEIIGLSSDTLRSSTSQPSKHTFCTTDRKIDWIDGIDLLLAINVWNCMIIWQQLVWEIHWRLRLPTSQVEFQKMWRGPRPFMHFGGHLMRLMIHFYDKWMRLITHYQGRPN